MTNKNIMRLLESLIKEEIKLFKEAEQPLMNNVDADLSGNPLVQNNPTFPEQSDDDEEIPTETELQPNDEEQEPESTDPIEDLWNKTNELFDTTKDETTLLKFLKSNIQDKFMDFKEALPLVDKLNQSNELILKNVAKRLKQFIEVN